MTIQHVPIERRFAKLSEKHLVDPDFLSLWGDNTSGSLSWDDFKDNSCVVVLADGKCGKTHEFKRRNEILQDKGHVSFFIPLEQLQDSEVLDILSDEEERLWEGWLASPDQTAVFFLDAVDELKLRQETLRKALRKVKNTLKKALSRARFFISCRPSDWDEELDVQALSTILPPKKIDQTQLQPKDGEQVFLEVISRNEPAGNKTERNLDDNDSTHKIKVVSLLPFTPNETLKFAKLYSPNTYEQFNRELSEKELWHIYRTPYEIISALEQLENEGQLGNLQEQLDYGIKQKLREISDKKRNCLSQDKALDGAGQIALAFLMTKTRSIKLTSKESALKIQDVLTDWTFDECDDLLSKPIFDPTGVESFRFHHRSTQEYLAASRLRKLRELGLNTNDLFSQLFASIKNEKVVIPSMEPVVAWLALWYPDVYKEVKAHSPSLMFRQGIPALLTVECRAELIRKYVDMYYQDKTWRGIQIGLSDLKRLSAPELSPVINELWDKAYSGIDTRELLLELIYLTPMPICTDLALKALFDEHLPIRQRACAGWSVLEFGQQEQKVNVKEAILKGEWSHKLIRSLLDKLIPDVMCVDDFVAFVKSLPDTPNDVHGLGFSIMKAVMSESLSDEQKNLLRGKLAQAVWDNRCAESSIHKGNSKYNHFVDAVIKACFLTVPDEQENVDEWAWCLAVAFHFGERNTSIIALNETKELVNMVSQNPKLREAYYWACLSLVEEFETYDSVIFADHSVKSKNILSPFTHNDLLWLERAFIKGESKNKKDAAFHQIIQLVKHEPSSRAIEFLSSSLSAGTEYADILEQTLTTPERKPDRYELESHKAKERFDAQETKRIEVWKVWRDKVLASEDFCLGEDEYKNTIFNLFKFLKQSHECSMWVTWDSNLIERAFSKKFVDALKPILSDHWKTANIQLFSERNNEAKNSFSYETLMALIAVKSESESKCWPTGLTEEQVRQAVRISTIEPDKFANYLHSLTDMYPVIVEEVITLETQKQLEYFSELGKAPILYDTLYSDYRVVKSAVIKAILTKLDIVESSMFKGSNTDLKYAFELVSNYGTDTSKALLAEVVNRFLDSAIYSLNDRNTWIKRLVNLDLVKGCERIIEFTENRCAEGSLNLFAHVFGGRYSEQQSTFEDIESTQQRLALLKPLFTRSHEVVQLSSDIKKEGSFTPDYAERARSFLFKSLCKVESPHTIDTLYEFSANPSFKDVSCKLHQAAIDLAARISEPKPMPVERFNKFNKEQNYQPYDDRSLFMVMNNRLDDFEHSLLNGEATIVDTLRKVDQETALRRFISNHLSCYSRDAYTVNQEAVVAAEKRTDIRLNVDRIDRYASIELKLDDSTNRWSGSNLKVALVEQLIGRYLNHQKCYVGCLLICIRESRRWENPDTKEKMNLEETVSWLQEIADKITLERTELRVSVKGIDYSKIANE